jgi:hypothetical protein
MEASLCCDAMALEGSAVHIMDDREMFHIITFSFKEARVCIGW